MASEPSASGLMSGDSENGAGIALCGFPLWENGTLALSSPFLSF